MTVVFNLLLFTHLVSVVVGASTNVAMPIIGRYAASASPEARPLIGSIAGHLSRNSQRALALLVITGLCMVAIVVAEGRVTSPSPWFIAKMGFLLALLALMVLRRVPFIASIKPATMGMLMRVVLLGIIFCSVMAFN